MDAPCRSYNDQRTLFATFYYRNPAVTRDDIWAFFRSKFGEIVSGVTLHNHSPPLHGWIVMYTPEMAKEVLGEGPLPLKVWIPGGKSMWLKPHNL